MYGNSTEKGTTPIYQIAQSDGESTPYNSGATVEATFAYKTVQL